MKGLKITDDFPSSKYDTNFIYTKELLIQAVGGYLNNKGCWDAMIGIVEVEDTIKMLIVWTYNCGNHTTEVTLTEYPAASELDWVLIKIHQSMLDNEDRWDEDYEIVSFTSPPPEDTEGGLRYRGE